MKSTTQRVRGILSPFGVAVLLIGMGMIVMAVTAGWVESLAIGVGLYVMLGVCALMTIGRHPYAVTAELHRERVIAGERSMVVVTVRNTTKRPVRPVSLELEIGSSIHRSMVPRLSGRKEHQELISIQTTQRGVIAISEVMTVRGDPLGLLARRVKWTKPLQLFVHPATVRLRMAAIGAVQDLDGLEGRRLADADLNFHALREYEWGDDRRAIHWRSSAKLGQLMVRQFMLSERSHNLVILDPVGGNYRDSAEQEVAVSMAASLGRGTMEQGGEVSIVNGFDTVPTHSMRGMLDGFSLIEVPQDELPSKGSIPEVLGATVAMIVTGRRASLEDIQPLTRGLPDSLPKVLLMLSDVSAPELSYARGITLVRCAGLDDLAKVLQLVASR